jgi:tetratricopeptide (TPR) repeat protein
VSKSGCHRISFQVFQFTLEPQVRKLLQILRTTLLIVFACLAFPIFADESAHENLFQKGLAAYQNKQYPEAQKLFQQLLSEGTLSAELLHNLALTDYQLGQKPMALALWRKALTVDPGFPAARTARDYLENELQQRGWEKDRITQSLRQTLETVSLFELLWMMALILGLAGWFWLNYWGKRFAAIEEEQPLPGFPATAAILTVILLAVGGLTVLKAQYSLKKRATITGNIVNARSLPAVDGVQLFELRGGAEVMIRRQNGDWYQVQNSDAASGWVSNQDLFITSGH